MLLQNGVGLRLAEAALLPFLFSPVISRSSTSFYLRGATSCSPSSILYVTSNTRTPSSQFLDPLPFMILTFPPVSLPHQDPRIVDDLFILLSLKAISKFSTSTLPPTQWIKSHLFLWSSQTQTRNYSIHQTSAPFTMSYLLREGYVRGW